MTDQQGKKDGVLLVDDDKFLLDIYARKFVQENYDVHACLSVAEALEALRGGFMPDVILFDLVMPGQDGFALLQSLRDEKLAPSAVKIALTNENDEAERRRAEELGAKRYFIKATMIPAEVVNSVESEIAQLRKG